MIDAITFIVVLVALIVVHEFGHFIVAKLSGMRVDEFGIGYPPRALTIGKWGETEYTLNWLPFGGFVKIYGEDDSQKADPRAFSARPRILQALVLVAGVAMNMLFAYILITAALVSGTPRALAPSEIAQAHDKQLAVAAVLPSSPAAKAGMVAGDIIIHAEDGHYAYDGSSPLTFSDFVKRGGTNSTITLDVRQAAGTEKTLFVRPTTGLVPSDPSAPAIGVEIATIGVVPMSFGKAITEGAQLTWGTTVITAQGLWQFFKGVFTFSANLSQVSGPVGIAQVVGNATSQGVGDLLSIMALISINLALINLIPIPALDGGRLLFVIIEAILRRPIKPRVAQTVNAAGFTFLILLMVVVTAHDIFRIVG